MADAAAGRGAEVWRVEDHHKQEVQSIRGRAWRVFMRVAEATLRAAKAAPKLEAKISKRLRVTKSLRDFVEQLSAAGHLIDTKEICGRVTCDACLMSVACNRSSIKAWVGLRNCVAATIVNDAVEVEATSEVIQEPQCDFDLQLFEILSDDEKGVYEHKPSEAAPKALVNQTTVFAGVAAPTVRFISGNLGVGDRFIHRSHKLAEYRSIIFCRKCGRWSTQNPRGLVTSCTGMQIRAGKQALARLRAEKHPRSQTHLTKEDGPIRLVRIL